LVDECLKRALWNVQKTLGESRLDFGIDWWAPHAPEPITLAQWIMEAKAGGRLFNEENIRILHPDPPLGSDEKAALEQIATLSGHRGHLDIMTPRMLAARGV
jgi:hypothetical protein